MDSNRSKTLKGAAPHESKRGQGPVDSGTSWIRWNSSFFQEQKVHFEFQYSLEHITYSLHISSNISHDVDPRHATQRHPAQTRQRPESRLQQQSTTIPPRIHIHSNRHPHPRNYHSFGHQHIHRKHSYSSSNSRRYPIPNNTHNPPPQIILPAPLTHLFNRQLIITPPLRL
jgi:hypothetical protein